MKEVTGRIQITFEVCTHTEESEDIFLLEDMTDRWIPLSGSQEILGVLKHDQRVTITGEMRNLVDPALSEEVSDSSFITQNVGLWVQNVRVLPVAQGGGGDMEVALQMQSTSTTEMLSCLLVFVSTNTKDCVFRPAVVREVLFDNITNVNLGMQAITKGKYGLKLGNGTGVPEDHIVEIKFDVDNTALISPFWPKVLEAVQAKGINPDSYNRILIFQPQGQSGSAYAVQREPHITGSAGFGRITVYNKNSLSLYLHELGHNFNFGHAATPKSGGKYSWYGDTTCVMGSGNGNYNAAFLANTGWLDEFPEATEILTSDMTLNVYPVSSDLTQMPGVIIGSIPDQELFVSYVVDDRPYGKLSKVNDRDTVLIHGMLKYINSYGEYFHSVKMKSLTVGQSYGSQTKISFDRYGPDRAYATVSIDVDDGNAKPVAKGKTVATHVNVPVAIPLNGTDADSDPLTYEIVDLPELGVLSGTIPNMIYTPYSDSVGEDSFQFLVNDGKISSFATVTVSIYSNTNPPVVDAGPDRTAVILSGTSNVAVSLLGNVWDTDGSNGGPVTTSWSKHSGPGSIVFKKTSDLATTATFNTPGTYVLKLTASDMDYTSVDEVTITIFDETDSDGDGLSDSWEQFYFSNLDNDGSGDSDGDRYTDLEEFTLNFNPVLDQAPLAPTGVVASPGDRQITLEWEENTDKDFKSYTVYRSTESGVGYSPIQTLVGTSSYVDTMVENWTDYFYVVTASDHNGGESVRSNETSATPLPGTLFIGDAVSGASDNLINTEMNWSRALPTEDLGIIPIDAKYHSGYPPENYTVLHINGTLSSETFNGGLTLGSGSSWVMDGPDSELLGRGVHLRDALFTLKDGVGNVTSNASDSTVFGAGGHMIIQGGILTVGGRFLIGDGGRLTVNGGSVTIEESLENPSFRSAPGPIQFNGGQTTADRFLFENSAMIIFGGAESGSVRLLSTLGSGAVQNWLAGTKMTLSANTVEWASTEWDADRLLFNGQNKSDMGNKTWAQVTAPDGLAPGARFIYDGLTKTLRLESNLSLTAQEQYFQNAGLPYNSDPYQDADGDGISNGDEFTAGTNPNDISSLFSITSVEESGGIRIQSPCITGKYYRLSWRNSLATGEWIPIPGYGGTVPSDGTPLNVP